MRASSHLNLLWQLEATAQTVMAILAIPHLNQEVTCLQKRPYWYSWTTKILLPCSYKLQGNEEARLVASMQTSAREWGSHRTSERLALGSEWSGCTRSSFHWLALKSGEPAGLLQVQHTWNRPWNRCLTIHWCFQFYSLSTAQHRSWTLSRSESRWSIASQSQWLSLNREPCLPYLHYMQKLKFWQT